jgi:hypothetical protein
MSTATNPGAVSTPSPAQTATEHASPPAKLVRILHFPVPDLTYKVQIRDRPGPLHDPSNPSRGYTTHTLALEPTLFSFATSTFSFANFGPFSHFLTSHTPANIASITRVQWEARDSWDVAGGSTLTVAKMLVDKLPGLKEVVLLQVMGKKARGTWTVKRNLEAWENGLRNLKDGLTVTVKSMEPGKFEERMKGGSFRRVDPMGGRVSARNATGRRERAMDERAAYYDQR